MVFEEIVQPEEFGIIGKTSLFKGTEYLVPIYQRNFAWEIDEIEQLLDDILDSDPNSKYYLGSLIVNQRSANVFEVVDGQQRLTTLFLLLSFLNDESINSNSLRFEAREKSNKTLTEINRLTNENEELENKAWFSEEIINGYSIIKKYFARNTEKTKGFESIFKEKLSHIAIIRTQVPHNIDLNHYFEVMNTRGEQLELHEIVKGKILEKIDREDRRIVAEIWDACAQMDKYVQMSFSKETRECLFGTDWDVFPYTSFDSIRPMFTYNCENSTKSDSDDNKIDFTLISKLKDNGKKVKHDLLDDKNDDNETFRSIISFPNFLLQVNEALGFYDGNDEDSGLDDKNFMNLMERHYSNKEHALAFVFSLLKFRFIFDKYIIKREYAKDYKLEGRWSLQQLKKRPSDTGDQPSYKGTYSNDDIEMTSKVRLLQSCLRVTYTSPKTMHWISKVLLELSENENSNVVSILEKFCCEKVIASNYASKTGFGIDRIVFTFLDYLLVKNNPKKYPNYQFQFRTSIEHFYPQNPINGEYWEDGFLNCFGNLALITVSANSKFSNMLPHQKAENYEENIEQSPKLMLMRDEMKKNNGKWERETAIYHHRSMMKILEDEILSYQ